MAETAIVETPPQQTLDSHEPVGGPARFIGFLKDTRREMHKVVTPSREEVQTNTIIVIVTVFVLAAYFAIIDNTLGHLIDKALLKLTGH